jgi:hypothetical protein
MSSQNELTIMNKTPVSTHILVWVSWPFNDSFIDNNRSCKILPGNTMVNNEQILGLHGYAFQLCGLKYSTNRRIMNWIGYGRMWLWPILKILSKNLSEGSGENHGNLRDSKSWPSKH